MAAIVLGARGCLPPDRYYCSGSVLDCGERGNADCEVGDGCTYGPQCIFVQCGVQKTEPNCRAQAYCTWYPDTKQCLSGGADPPECGGRSQTTCSALPSCIWSTACAGSVTMGCFDHKDQASCSKVPDCNWGSSPGI
jgi:hypothetical protein